MTDTTAAASTVRIVRLVDADALFDMDRDRQLGNYLELDLETGDLTCGTDLIDGFPRAVRDRRWLRLEIPCLTAESANALLEEAEPIAQRILAGSVIERRDTNYYGVMDEGALAAEDDLIALIGTYGDAPTVSRMYADEWFSEGDAPPVTADLTDAELATLTSAVEEEIRQGADDVVVPFGVEEYLTGLRAELRTAVDEELQTVAAERVDLVAERDELLHRLHRGNAIPLRRLADLAGITPPGVRRIVGEEGQERGEVDPDRLGDNQAAADLARLAEIGPQIAPLTARRDELVRRIRAWQDDSRSDRYIAGLARLSHTQVQNIAAAAAA